MSRDTQFAHFAALLIPEIDEQIGAVTEWALEHDIDNEKKVGHELATRWLQVISRRAYDFACHIASQVSEWNGAEMEVHGRTPQEVVDEMADMHQWPEEKNK